MSDIEYTDSEYDSDNDEEINNIIYEPDEISNSRFNIALCELYNSHLHGLINSEVLYHYLVHTRYKSLHIGCISDIANNLNNEYIYLLNQSHDIFRNYREIITRENYIKPEIIECIYLDTGHCVGIIKTFWIKLIQRTWKNILKKREIVISMRCNPISLRHREITGKWPKKCSSYPRLKGMLARV